MKRLREFLESILFAGMKPGARAAAARPQLGWLRPLRAPVERVLSGGPAPSDPLYLSNRSSTQKLKSWGLIAVLSVVFALGVAVVYWRLDPSQSKPDNQPTAAEITAKLPANLTKHLTIAPSSALQVIEVRVDSSRVIGIVENITTSEIAATDLVIDLIDARGSVVGSVKGTVGNIPALSRKQFQFPQKQRDASIAIVRQILTH